MKREYRTIPLFMFLVVMLSISGCAPTGIELKDIPVPPYANKGCGPGALGNLPNLSTIVWVSDLYHDHELAGENCYYLQKYDLKNSSLDDFYNAQLTKMGWKQDKQDIYLGTFGVPVVRKTWVKNNQAIVLDAFDNPGQSSVLVLVVYLLTK